MAKRDDSIQWWDRGRARWRSRPENKERSYDESVGGKRRPVRELYSPSRSAMRVALAQCCVGADESVMDRALDRSDDRERSWRWKHSLPRRTVVDRKRVRRVCGYARAHWVSRAWSFRWAWLRRMKVAGDFFSMYELKRALTEAARSVFAKGQRGELRTSAAIALEEHPQFREHVPHGWKRRSLARRCIRALVREREQSARFADTLRAIISGAGKFAPMFAVVFYVALHADTVPLWMWRCTSWYRGYSERLTRELAKDPKLDAAMRAWVERHMPSRDEIVRLFDAPPNRTLRRRW